TVAEPETASESVVVCVDGSKDLLHFLTSLLRVNGYRAVSASNFPDAKSLLQMSTTKLALFGPNQVNSQHASSTAALRNLAPDVPVIEVADKEDVAAMSLEILDAVAEQLPNRD